MKTRILLTLALCVSLFASVQAQEFRYGLSGGYNYHSTKENMPSVRRRKGCMWIWD